MSKTTSGSAGRGEPAGKGAGGKTGKPGAGAPQAPAGKSQTAAGTGAGKKSDKKG